MKKKYSIAIIIMGVVMILTFGFLQNIGSTYVYGKLPIRDILVDALVNLQAIEFVDLGKEELKELQEYIDEIEKIDPIKEAGTFQLAYMNREKEEEIRRVIVEDNQKAEAIPVLMYHHLVPEKENIYEGNDSVITVESFAQQMGYLYENNYYTITLPELEAFLAGDLDLPKKTVVITFDDGYLSNIVYAYPILKKYDFKATNFLISNRLQEISEDFDPYQLQYLSWEDMLNTLDVFDYANHTHDFHELEGRFSYVVTKPLKDVIKDLSMNKSLLSSPYFAYPYGQYSNYTPKILELLGIRMAFTTQRGPVRSGDDVFRLRRYNISPKTTMKDFKKIIDYNKF